MGNFIEDKYVKDLLRNIVKQLENLNSSNAGAIIPANYFNHKVDEASASITYVGYSEPGAASSANTWVIKKIEVDGTETTYSFAKNVAWNDRATVSYV